MIDENPTLMDTLRKASLARHAELAKLPFITALIHGTLPFASYIEQLRALVGIHEAIEQGMRRQTIPGITQLLLARPSRLAQLQSDLGSVDGTLIRGSSAAVERSQAVATEISTMTTLQTREFLGVLYVMEGSTLGNAVHLADVKRCFGDLALGCSRYYTGYGERTAAFWQEFRTAMNALEIDTQGRAQVVSASLRLFDRLESLYSALPAQ